MYGDAETSVLTQETLFNVIVMAAEVPWFEVDLSIGGKTELVEVNRTLYSQRYCDDIVLPVVVPFLRQGNSRIYPAATNARPHTAHHTQITLLTTEQYCQFLLACTIARFVTK